MRRSQLLHALPFVALATLAVSPVSASWAKPGIGHPTRFPRPIPRPGLRAPSAGPAKAGPLPAGASKAHAPMLLGAIPKQNKAMYLGWKGRIDTQVDVKDFFDDDHTLAIWYNPQFPYAYAGPLVLSSGGMLFLGQGDYRSGDGGFKHAGHAVLTIRIGNQKAMYAMPSTTYRAGTWVHLAMVRRSDEIELWVNGYKQTPVKKSGSGFTTAPPIHVPSTLPNAPRGTLHLGRIAPTRKGVKPSGDPGWQAYGIVDDFAVFDAALDAGEIRALVDHERLRGNEAHLTAGFSFDDPEKKTTPLPPKLRAPVTDNSRAYHVPVSANRSSADAITFENVFIIGETTEPMKLPFKKDEVWRVVQGNDAPGGSHNGYAAFCWDFTLAKGSGEYPNGPQHAPVYAVATGKLESYYATGPIGDHEGFTVHVATGPGEVMTYMHFAENQLTPKAKDGVPKEGSVYLTIPEGQRPTLSQGELVGKIGPKARHLHFAVNARFHRTTPAAFTDYWVSEDQGKTWKKVVRGMPKVGQWIKRRD